MNRDALALAFVASDNGHLTSSARPC
jgi:hypothetical protein